jgi:hypothetical protein
MPWPWQRTRETNLLAQGGTRQLKASAAGIDAIGAAAEIDKSPFRVIMAAGRGLHWPRGAIIHQI